MRILSTHYTPMERQVREAVNIGESSKNGKECLNLKSEWGMAKIPGLKVWSPKGLARTRQVGEGSDQDSLQVLEEATKRGNKRIYYVDGEDEEEEEEKEGEGTMKAEAEPRYKRIKRSTPDEDKENH